MKKIMTVVLVFLFGIQAYSLTIVRNFIGGTPPTNSIGTGNLPEIFDAACDVWEMTYPYVNATVTIDYCWTNMGSADHQLIAQGGTPNRETIGLIRFNNDNIVGHYAWYLDPSPLTCSLSTNGAPTSYEEQRVDLGHGLINASRRYTCMTGADRTDLFTVALHEIGHALGLSLSNSSFVTSCSNNCITITSGPYTGMMVPLQHNNAGVIAHIDYSVFPYYIYGRTLMSGSYSPAERILPSALDIELIAGISRFAQPNTDLRPILKMGVPYTPTQPNALVLPSTKVVDLTWIQILPPPPGTQYKVEQCTDLSQGSWSVVTAPITDNKGRYTMTVPFTGNTFFRLRAQ